MILMAASLYSTFSKCILNFVDPTQCGHPQGTMMMMVKAVQLDFLGRNNCFNRFRV